MLSELGKFRKREGLYNTEVQPLKDSGVENLPPFPRMNAQARGELARLMAVEPVLSQVGSKEGK